MSSESVDILIVDDDSDHCDIVQRRLHHAGLTCRQAGSAAEALELMERVQPSVILSDWMMPGMDGLELCRRVRRNPATVGLYFILLTARADTSSVTLALEMGADDFLAKPCDPRELIARIRVGLRVWTLQSELKRSATTDGLTGLYNHPFFATMLEREFARCARYNKPMAVMMADLDHFKAVNDTFGHEAGNLVLKRAAELLAASVREVDTLARYGGEEFALIAPETQRVDAIDLAERLRSKLATSLIVPEAGDSPTTCSIGVATNGDPRATSGRAMLDLADKALYVAKRTGRNRVCVSDQVKFEELAELGSSGDEIDHLRKQITTLELQAKTTFLQSVWALVQTLEARDPFTARHSQNVTFYAEDLARELDLTPAMVRAVRNGAMLHDIGKVGVPDCILMKPGKLSKEEMGTLRTVPEISARILGHMRMLELEVQIIRHQHEFYDGTGAPAGLAGDEIPIGARVLHVADAFEALTSDRVYRDRLSVEDAQAVLRKCAGQQFDPKVVDALHEAMRKRHDLWINHIFAARRQIDALGGDKDRRQPELSLIGEP